MIIAFMQYLVIERKISTSYQNQSINSIKFYYERVLDIPAGLRLSEVVNLRIKDIDSERMKVFVQQAKGRKDRYTSLSKKVLPVLRQYFMGYKPKEWLFEGAKGRKYSVSSCTNHRKKCLCQSWHKKESFDTHLKA